MEVKRVCEGLNEFELEFKASPVCGAGVVVVCAGVGCSLVIVGDGILRVGHGREGTKS